MISNILTPVLIVASMYVQSTMLRGLEVKPDIALIMLVLYSNRSGSMKGQLTGFALGLIRDLLFGPLGFFSFIYTLIGFLAGRLKNEIFLDMILMPILLGIVATLLKALLAFALSAVFIVKSPDIFTMRLLIEIGLNGLIAPFIYGLLRLFKLLSTKERAFL